MIHELPKLPYALNALEPYISQRTVEFHYGKHHQAYVTNLNKLIAGTEYENSSLEDIIRKAGGGIFNNGAQIWNHTFYFEGLKPGNTSTLSGPFADVIKRSFGSVSFFKKTFTNAGISVLVSGWIWLVLNSKGTLEILKECQSGNPIRTGFVPLLNCDLWEHAYYLDYQNRRQEYLDIFWKFINWEIVEKRYYDSV